MARVMAIDGRPLQDYTCHPINPFKRAVEKVYADLRTCVFHNSPSFAAWVGCREDAQDHDRSLEQVAKKANL